MQQAGIIVLGAGVAALSTALPLARAGRPVTVIDTLSDRLRMAWRDGHDLEGIWQRLDMKPPEVRMMLPRAAA
jgi:glycine/D-amino acid oxidase-like deaminating enzyme